VNYQAWGFHFAAAGSIMKLEFSYEGVIDLELKELALEEEIEALVEAGGYKDREEVGKEAFRIYKEAKPEKKIAIAVGLYEKGRVSLARAAEIAGTDLESFKEILAQFLGSAGYTLANWEVLERDLHQLIKTHEATGESRFVTLFPDREVAR